MKVFERYKELRYLYVDKTRLEALSDKHLDYIIINSRSTDRIQHPLQYVSTRLYFGQVSSIFPTHIFLISPTIFLVTF